MKKISFLFLALIMMMSCSNEEFVTAETQADEKSEMQTKDYWSFNVEVLSLDVGDFPVAGRNSFCVDDFMNVTFLVQEEGRGVVLKRCEGATREITEVLISEFQGMNYTLCAGPHGELFYANDYAFGEIDPFSGQLNHMQQLFPNQSIGRRFWGLTMADNGNVFIGCTESNFDNGSYTEQYKIYRLTNNKIKEIATIDRQKMDMNDGGLFKVEGAQLYAMGNQPNVYAKVGTMNGNVEYVTRDDIFFGQMTSSPRAKYPYVTDGFSIIKLGTGDYSDNYVGNISTLSILNEMGEPVLVSLHSFCVSYAGFSEFYVLGHREDNHKLCLLKISR